MPECGPGLERRGDGEEAGQEQAVAAPAASLSGGTRGAVSPPSCPWGRGRRQGRVACRTTAGDELWREGQRSEPRAAGH